MIIPGCRSREYFEKKHEQSWLSIRWPPGNLPHPSCSVVLPACVVCMQAILFVAYEVLVPVCMPEMN